MSGAGLFAGPAPAGRVVNPWVTMASGRRLYVFEPTPESFTLEDVARGLANECRYGGHLRHDLPLPYYSVAQHSVLVSRNVPPPLRLAALFHDAAEFVLGDPLRPFRHLVWFRDAQAPHHCNESWLQLEQRYLRVIADMVGIAYADFGQAEVRIADKRVFAAEVRDIVEGRGADWMIELPTPVVQPVDPVGPVEAFDMFMDEYQKLHAE